MATAKFFGFINGKILLKDQLQVHYSKKESYFLQIAPPLKEKMLFFF